MVVEHETDFDADIIKGLQALGHVTDDVGSAGSVVGAVVRDEAGVLTAKADHRKSGAVSGF